MAPFHRTGLLGQPQITTPLSGEMGSACPENVSAELLMAGVNSKQQGRQGLWAGAKRAAVGWPLRSSTPPWNPESRAGSHGR